MNTEESMKKEELTKAQEESMKKQEELMKPQEEPIKPQEASKTQVIRNWGPEDEPLEKKRSADFVFFGPATLLYAVFYAFCMCKNASGITFPFFVASSILYIFCSLKRLGLTFKKENIFYPVGLMLLAVSTFCTDDARIIAMNHLGVFLLTVTMLLAQFFDTKNWGLGTYFSNILSTVFLCVEYLNRPFRDCKRFVEQKKLKNLKTFMTVAFSIAISLPLVLVMGAILGSADVLFQDMLDNLTERLFQWINIGNVYSYGWRILVVFLFTYCFGVFLCKGSGIKEMKPGTKKEPLVAITINLMLSIMYAVFCWVQIGGLFLGRMSLPEGYTYAEYAREGFFQLLFVSMFNLVLVLLSMMFAKESALLKAVLTFMSGCTFVMIASSMLRMLLYIQYMYLTFLRIFVLWALVVLTLIFVGVVLSIFWKKFPLFRYSMVVVTILYIGLSFAKPDYWIAKINLPHIQEQELAFQTGAEKTFFRTKSRYTDYSLLENLCADAAPAIMEYYENGQNTGTHIDGEYYDWIDTYKMHLVVKRQVANFRNYNLSRAKAFSLWKINQ